MSTPSHENDSSDIHSSDIDAQATAFVFGELSGDEAITFMKRMESSPELQAAVESIRGAVGAIENEFATEDFSVSHNGRSRVNQAILGRPPVATPEPPPVAQKTTPATTPSGSRRGLIALVTAACVLLLATLAWPGVKQQVALNTEVHTLKQRIEAAEAENKRLKKMRLEIQAELDAERETRATVPAAISAGRATPADEAQATTPTDSEMENAGGDMLERVEEQRSATEGKLRAEVRAELRSLDQEQATDSVSSHEASGEYRLKTLKPTSDADNAGGMGGGYASDVAASPTLGDNSPEAKPRRRRRGRGSDIDMSMGMSWAVGHDGWNGHGDGMEMNNGPMTLESVRPEWKSMEMDMGMGMEMEMEMETEMAGGMDMGATPGSVADKGEQFQSSGTTRGGRGFAIDPNATSRKNKRTTSDEVELLMDLFESEATSSREASVSEFSDSADPFAGNADESSDSFGGSDPFGEQPDLSKRLSTGGVRTLRSQYGGDVPSSSSPNLPNYAWPGYAGQPNYAALNYPRQNDDPFGEVEPQGGDRFEPITDNPFKPVGDAPLSTFSIDVDTAAYSKVRMYLMQHRQLPSPAAVRIEEMINYFDYNYDPPQDEHPFAASMEVADCPWKPGHRLARIGIKGKVIDQERPSSNLVFLLDVSGSMNNANKLPLVIDGMTMLTEQLTENDSVAIVVYAGAAGMVLDSTTGDKKKTIIDALARLKAGGSTNGGRGIQLAYQIARDNFVVGGTNRVILCSDGDFNVGVTGTDALTKIAADNAKGDIFLSVLGFGMGNHNDSMMEQVSNQGNGNYAFIDSKDEARKVLVDQMEGTLVTIAKDVKIQVEFNPEEVAAYRLIGYENRILAAKDFNDDKKDAGEIGAGHTVTALYEIVPKPDNETESADEEHQEKEVDDLRYQKQIRLSEQALSGELLTLKLRYKQPTGTKSTLIQFPVKDDEKRMGDADQDFQFAASVAAFGMLLRNSPHKSDTNFDLVEELASTGAKDDASGYRDEFLEMVKRARELRGE